MVVFRMYTPIVVSSSFNLFCHLNCYSILLHHVCVQYGVVSICPMRFIEGGTG